MDLLADAWGLFRLAFLIACGGVIGAAGIVAGGFVMASPVLLVLWVCDRRKQPAAMHPGDIGETGA